MKIGWGIDVGVGSLGFAVIELDERGQPKQLIDGVASVYPAPTGAIERTRFKSMRTQNKRSAKRMKTLRNELKTLFDLHPDFDSENSWPDLTDGVKADGSPRRNNSRVRLRAHGLSDRLSGADLARAILHIAKNRGQRLTRGLKDENAADDKEQKAAAKERQSMANSANATRSALTDLGKKLGLAGDAHPSQLLMENAKKLGVTRLKKDREGLSVFTRGMVERELDALLKAQKPYHTVLTDGLCDRLKYEVFREAEPKPPAIGACCYRIRNSDGEIERRLARGSDLFQRKRIYEEVNNLRLISSRTAAEQPLDLAQRDHLAGLLLDGEDLSAARVRKELGLKNDALADKTSLDITDRRAGRKTAGKLLGHPLAAAMAKANALDQWREADDALRGDIAELVRTEDDIEKLRIELVGRGLTKPVVAALIDARLPASHSAAGPTATGLLLDQLTKDVISNYEAEKRAGLEPTDPQPPSLDRLPYYGEILSSNCIGATSEADDPVEIQYGRIPNPVVHVALNRIRKVANEYLALYGKPDRICIELARDLNKSAEEREKAEKENRTNRNKNEQYIEKLGAHTRKLTAIDLTRIKLHDMQGGECMYTGKPISMRQLFDGSVQIDHILPRAETRDDGIANLALAFVKPNQDKAKRPPFEAFNPTYEGQDYAQILRRAWKRGNSVYWRFKEDAMDRFRDQAFFQRRFLNDTRYVGKMAARYLQTVCTVPNEVICLNGRITSDLRREWGLGNLIRNMMIEDGRLAAEDVVRPREGESVEELSARRKRIDKIRWDHRHHLLDAIVAACTTRSDVHRLQTLAARDTGDTTAIEVLAEVRRADPEFRTAGICWRDDFSAVVKEFLSGKRSSEVVENPPAIAVVPKADHGIAGQLHDQTNYGVICAVPGKPGQYVTRDHVSIRDLTPEQIERIAVPDTVLDAVSRAQAEGAQFWWGGDNPAATLKNNLAKDLVELRSRLLELMEQAPSDALENAKTEKGRMAARAKWAVAKNIEETGRRRFTRVQITSVKILKGPERHNYKPKRVNPTGGNDRLIYYVNAQGNRALEVVSTLDANTHGFKERWRREGGRLLFALRKNDLVEMTIDPSDLLSGRRIYRTVSFSYSGSPDLEFLPVEEARGPKLVPKGVRVRLNSLKAFEDRAPVMVLCDPTGRVRWRGPNLN